MPSKGQKTDKSLFIDGYAVSSKIAPAPIRKAYKSWVDQKQRCTNKNNPRYKWWGAKGIRQEYTAYEFVTWWLKEWQKRPYWKRPNCSRIDHTKNYTLDNIELLECSENATERIVRKGVPGSRGVKIKATNIDTGEERIFYSVYKAHKDLRIAESAIHAQVQNGCKTKPTRKWLFEKCD